MVETCTQVDVRYYVKYKISKGWAVYLAHLNGFKSLRNATRALRKARDFHSILPRDDYKLFKQTKTIEIRTTTKEEMLND